MGPLSPIDRLVARCREPRVATLALALVAVVALFVGSTVGELRGIYAETSLAMAERGGWLTPRVGDELYVNKPPLMFWLTAATMRVGGANAFTATLWPRIAGVAAVLLTARLGARLRARRVGWLAGFALATTPLFIHTATAVRLDPPLAAAVVGALLAYFARAPRAARVAGFAACVAVGVLAKGPQTYLALLLVLVHAAVAGRLVAPWRRPALAWAAALPLMLAPLAWWLVLGAQSHDALARVAADARSGGTGWAAARAAASYYADMLAAQCAPWTWAAAIGIACAIVRLRRGRLRREQRAREALLLTWIAATAIGIAWKNAPAARYLVIALPALAILAADALAAGARAWARRGDGFARVVAMTLGVALVACALWPLPWPFLRDPSVAGLAAMRAALAGRDAAIPALVDADTAWWVRSWSRFYLRRDARPLAIADAAPPGGPFLVRRRDYAGFADGRALREIARSDEFVLAEAAP